MKNNTNKAKSQADKLEHKLSEITTEEFLQSAFDSLYDDYKDLQREYNELLNKAKHTSLALLQLIETTPKVILEYTSSDEYLPIPTRLAKDICEKHQKK